MPSTEGADRNVSEDDLLTLGALADNAASDIKPDAKPAVSVPAGALSVGGLAELRVAMTMLLNIQREQMMRSSPTLGASVGFPLLLPVSKNDTAHRLNNT
ncbi:hypothetical protein ISCGN_024525 [Ixodes scapularis]